MNFATFDIETGPDTDKRTSLFVPEFEAPGNVKDPQKIAEAIARKEQAWKEDLALSALTGRILVIGVHDMTEGKTLHMEGTEKAILTEFWSLVQSTKNTTVMIGHYVHTFDLPFIIRRSWHNGVDVPKRFLCDSRRWTDEGITDLLKVWGFGGRQPEDNFVSLDFLAKHLGVGEKNGNGKDFHNLYASDKSAALAYLDNDLVLTAGCAKKMLDLGND